MLIPTNLKLFLSSVFTTDVVQLYYTTKKIETLKTICMSDSVFIKSVTIINCKHFGFKKLNCGELVTEMKEEGSRICQTKFIDG